MIETYLSTHTVQYRCEKEARRQECGLWQVKWGEEQLQPLNSSAAGVHGIKPQQAAREQEVLGRPTWLQMLSMSCCSTTVECR